jgi:drug/metabolite transporter (DMT)-like permease
LKTRVTVIAAFAAIYFLWGGTYLAITIGLRSIPPFLLIAMRCAIGGLLLLMIANRFQHIEAPFKHWKRAAISGVLLFLGCHGLLAVAEKSTPSGFAALILATIPFWIVLLNVIWPSGDRPTLSSVACLLPGFVGVATVAWAAMSKGHTGMRSLEVAILIIAAFSWAVGTVIAVRRNAKQDALSFAGMELVFGAVALGAVSLASGEVSHFRPFDVSSTSWAALAFLAVAGTVIAFGAYIWLLQNVSSSLVATYTFVNPIVAVILGWAFLHETLRVSTFAGLILITVSVVGLSIQNRKDQTHDRRN